jgi:hypothetical protein
MHLSYDAEPKAYVSFEHKVQQLSQNSDLVFCIESELHNYHWSMYDQCHAQNVYWCQPGLVNDRPDMAPHIIFWGDWFKTTSAVYKDPEILPIVETYKPYNVKPKYFDALLGSPKPHRSYVASAVVDHGLKDHFIMTYGGNWHDNVFYAKDYFIWEPDTEIIEDAPGTMGFVRWRGHLCHLSQIIPTQVFNQTAYSIVAETDHDNTLSFFSEKTAKPMIYKRLFVAFSGYKFLHNLHSLGFQTFDCVIDESYDLVSDHEDRYRLAFEQVRWLCQQNQSEVLSAIQPKLEHNYNLMMNTNWTQVAIDRVNQVIADTFAHVG